jgi:hypothetical protein
MSEKKPTVYYSVDQDIYPPPIWPAPDIQIAKYRDIRKVDIIYININNASNFRMIHTGTNDVIHKAIIQITKHIARGLYRLVTLNASEYSCVVVMTTDKLKDELMWKNGFPWDAEYDPQPVVVLE